MYLVVIVICIVRDPDEGRPEEEKHDEAAEPLKPILKLEPAAVEVTNTTRPAPVVPS